MSGFRKARGADGVPDAQRSANGRGWYNDRVNNHGDSDGRAEWVLESVGSDRVMNRQVPVWPQNIAYEPTNGTVSIGEIFCWGPGLGTGFSQ